MKKWLTYIFIFSIITSCSIKHKLPADTYLYKGATVKINKTPDNDTKTKSVQKSLKGISSPKPNKTILGYPYKVAIWYAIGETKKQKGFKYWLRNRLGEAPVLSNTVNLTSNATNMTEYLVNNGYFKTTTSAGKKIKGYKMEAEYTVLLTKPYIVNHTAWVLDSAKRLTTDILKIDSSKNYVRKNKQFDLGDVKDERNRIDIALKTKGYYYFSPDYIKSYVDTTVGQHKLNIFFALKKDVPLKATIPQKINAITLFPNYTLLYPPPDTAKTGLIKYDSIYIRDTINNYKPFALTRSVTYKPGSLYNLKQHNKTLNRFINMGTFKFVKSRYELLGDSSMPDKMNVYYYLTPLKKKNIGAEIAGFSKSNSFTGARVDVNWKNRNVFKGAEQLNVKLYTAFETSSVDSLKGYNNFHVGGEVSLLVPRFAVPFKIKENNYFPPITKFTTGYEWFRRQQLFTENFYRLQYDITWKEQSNKEHSLSPASITYTNTSNYSAQYLQQLLQYSGLRYTLLPQIISGSFYNFLFNSKNPRASDILYLNANVELVGNIPGLLSKPDKAFSKKIAGAYFAQYTKFDVDFRYSHKLAENTYTSSRINIGVGMPYGNSSFLPFSRQYIIGGSNSLRGFPPRTLGPGRVLTTGQQQITYPQIGGDYKLELNTELRFPIFGKLRGALFADAGNIWTKTDVLYGPDAKFTKDFLKDLAVDAGVGVRVDITLLIIRLDVGVPLRKPWLAKGSEWVVKDIQFGNSDWRSGNLVFNFGVGYPF